MKAIPILLIIAVIAVSGCIGQMPEVPPVPTEEVSQRIELRNFEFVSNLIRVKQGDVIEFVNNEGTHTVTIEELNLDKVLNQGESYRVLIDREGTFVLTCRFHLTLGMMGVVSTEEITEDVETIVRRQAEERAEEARRAIEEERAPPVGEIQEFEIVETIYPGKFEPSVIVAKRGIPVRIYMTTTQLEHINRVSILPWISSSDTIFPGKITTIEFTPDQVGEFKIRNIGHGFEATFRVEE